jgi:PAS domain S-box-containing protein
VAAEGPPHDYGELAAEEDTLGPDRSGERKTVYWIILALLLGGSLLLRDNPYRSNVQTHTLSEALATLMAFLIGGLALVRFYSRKQATFLLIGTGFLGAGLLDLNHALITTDFLGSRSGADREALFLWSWTAERTFLSFFLWWSLLGWRREVRAEDGGGDTLMEGPVYVTALVLTLANLIFFEVVPMRVSHLPWLGVSRPTELVPAFLFGLAFLGFLKKGTWKKDAFEHWLLVALLISAMGHIGFMAFSEQRFDAMFDAAHFLKIASYLSILTGLLFSVYATFKREGKALSALTAANMALEREVAVRAETEVAAEENRSRLQDFLDNANDLIQSVGPEGRILYVNSSWKRVLGYSDEQLDQMKVYAAVHPRHRETFQSEVDRILAGGESRRFNVDYIAQDGRMVILSGSLVAQHVRGQAVACQGIFRDVTEQRLAERQLADSQANLGALVENTGDSIWSVDREHRLITFNSAFALAVEAQSGNEPEAGQLPGEIFRPEDKEWYQLVYERAMSGNRHVAVRTDEVDGQLRYFELYANPIQGEDGIKGAVLFGKDVTPRVRAEEGLRVAKEEAEAANKAKSDFLASMSHELRTPLNSVIGFTNILMKNREGRLEDREIGFLQRVLANGKHLLELINEVLDLAKVEAGRMELVIEEVDLAQLVTETVGQLEGQVKVKEGNVVLVADVPKNSNPVETDSSKLKQVIINLVGNALKFTHEGSVTVRLEMAQDGRTPTAIAVQDTGIGIPEERLDAIFEAFQQAEAGTSRKYGGTGLGLALSRSISLLMGYDLIVSSKEGEGSTFSIVMGERAKRPVRPVDEPEPAAPAEAGLASGRQEGPTPGGRPSLPGQRRITDFKVLVVDDEKDSRVLMAHYLEEFGCEVVTATDGQAGIDAARLHMPDLITLDLMMPGMTGWEVLKRLKADPELKGIPVVVVSIVAEEGRGRLLGAVDLVTKPFEREDILRVLWRNLARKRGGHVLVVDDDPDIRKLLTEMLSSVGLEATQAEDGHEALERIRAGAPDMVLLDLLMPSMDGRTFLEKLRADPLYTGLPVIVLSGKELSKGERNELARLASAVVNKGSNFEVKLFELLGSYFSLPDAPA